MTQSASSERTITLRILRRDNTNASARWEEFVIPWRPNLNIIACLQYIAAHPVTADGTKTTQVVYDSNCLEEVCGACTMLINGQTRQACSALVDKLDQPITLEPMTKFPLVRPRKVFNLQGTQEGNTLNPMTVTLNGTARAEFYVPKPTESLAAGTYYVMDYNMGELRFVTEAGVPVVPTNGWSLVVSGKYSTNAVKWDTDAVSGENVKDRYDRLLTVVGDRKALISSQRYYTPNLLLMSPTVDNAVSQATSFQANASRVATGLSADGSVGQIKSVPVFNTTAPNLMMGDSRILVGQRGNSRFRMLKPWGMALPEQMRDANGRFTDGTEQFGNQWVVVHTPTQLKNSLTSVVLYSATGRVARA